MYIFIYQHNFLQKCEKLYKKRDTRREKVCLWNKKQELQSHKSCVCAVDVVLPWWCWRCDCRLLKRWRWTASSQRLHRATWEIYHTEMSFKIFYFTSAQHALHHHVVCAAVCLAAVGSLHRSALLDELFSSVTWPHNTTWWREVYLWGQRFPHSGQRRCIEKLIKKKVTVCDRELHQLC